MHQRVCLFKTTGKRSGEHLDSTAKKLKDNTSRVGGGLNGTVNEYRLNLEDEQPDASKVLDVLKESPFQMENRIMEEVAKKRAVKLYLSLYANIHLSNDVTSLTNPPVVLSTDTIEMYDSTDIRDALNSIYENLTSAIEDFEQRGSGWVLDKLLAVDLHLLEFDPLRATSYIPLPTCIQNRKAVINIRNNDGKFLIVCIAGLYGDSRVVHRECVSHDLDYEKEFNFQGISFPMALKDIPKFEKANNLSIGKEDQEGFIYPLKV